MKLRRGKDYEKDNDIIRCMYDVPVTGRMCSGGYGLPDGWSDQEQLALFNDPVFKNESEDFNT